MRLVLLALTALVAPVISLRHRNDKNVVLRTIDSNGKATAELAQSVGAGKAGEAYFDQLLDHNDPSKGTFKQRYYWNSVHWKGPGAPVLLMTPGEQSAEGFNISLTSQALYGVLANKLSGAAIALEHRYWGQSSPFDNLTAETLQQLTLENSIKDLTYFARHVSLPFDTKNHSANAPLAPWVLSGGSYPGALSAWTAHIAPGTFWAYHDTSGPVQAIYDFYHYWTPVAEGMPANCSADLSRISTHVDGLAAANDTHGQRALQAKFGLASLKHYKDFASVLQDGPSLWQETSFTTGYSPFYQFCDAIEGVYSGDHYAGKNYSASGVGLSRALDNYAAWVRDEFLPTACTAYGLPQGDLSCLDTYDASSPVYTDTSVGNAANRQWEWMVCNEPFGWWQSGAPTGKHTWKNVTTIVPSVADADYNQRQCGLFFPRVGNYTYGSARGATEAALNARTGGWTDTEAGKRIVYVNGQWDPWRYATMSSNVRTGGPLTNTPEHPVFIIPQGKHCSDLYTAGAEVNAGVRHVVDELIKTISGWVGEFYEKKGVAKPWE